MQEIYQNFGQNGDKHGPRKQVDVEGPPGPTGQRCPTPPRCRPAPPSANLALCHVTDPWERLQSQSRASIQVSLINGQDLFMLDPWAHCHRLGSLHRPLGSLQVPPSLYTINRGCGAWWKDAPFISKPSKILLAF